MVVAVVLELCCRSVTQDRKKNCDSTKLNKLATIHFIPSSLFVGAEIGLLLRCADDW